MQRHVTHAGIVLFVVERVQDLQHKVRPAAWIDLNVGGIGTPRAEIMLTTLHLEVLPQLLHPP